jgi:hypothetical protein
MILVVRIASSPITWENYFTFKSIGRFEVLGILPSTNV